eukprot:CAMPEP_0203667180 /NCGR_PEP_ID=MMETSP0090-20130426/4062_1 /ASSEMBLY_ACC=CAM_ASM_001088 /TAXON_ID=426623 /ORGANISM="Chaetoceros affinis, Strain CCMP159" /LENGTH=914 /DNA_ID=CAMNT_0050531269 /DNA_START=322 /DNA_END=3063 /DNA_ORIENTATION=+
MNMNMNMYKKNQNSRKHTNQTRTACYLTIATLAIVAVTAISVHSINYITGGTYDSANYKYGMSMSTVSSTSTSTSSTNNDPLRYLEDANGDDQNGNGNEGNDDDNNNYSDQSCDDIFALTEEGSDERCLFSKTCNSNQGLQFNFVFCNAFNLSTNTWMLILSPLTTTWLILLFRMLGSTAEDFFSPSLEMFSIKLGLPPRFAGVTLLALGNGAADVSATINAIVQNPANGYQMSLGALTGAGMFVGTVVAGIVIVIADGVKCRGALVRDVLMFILTLGVVFKYFEGGVIGTGAVHCFLWMYFAFVLVVLVADIYHRKVVLPRMRRIEESMMALQDVDESGDHNVGAGQSMDSTATGGGVGGVGGGSGAGGTTASVASVASMGVTPSRDTIRKNQSSMDTDEGFTTADEYSTKGSQDGGAKRVTFDDSGDVELANTKTGTAHGSNSLHAAPDASFRLPTSNNTFDNNTSTDQGGEAFAVNPSSDDEGLYTSTDDDEPSSKKKKKKRLKFKRPKFGKKKKTKKTGELSSMQKGVDTFMMALSNYGPEEGNPNTRQSFKGWSGGLEVTSESMDKPVKLHGANGILSKKSSDEFLEDENEDTNVNLSGPSASYRVLLENVDNLCTADGSTSSGLNISWGNSLSTGWTELREHFAHCFNDIFENEQNNAFDKFFLVCEFPFTFIRKLSVPIPCDDFYCRGLVAASVALSPLWLGVYFLIERSSNLFYTGGFPTVEILSAIAVVIAIFVVKFAPADVNEMSLAVSVPIAFVGFIMAATWIDTVADQLVRLLTLLGVICRIPGSIMGITVLAWGNSMGDLSANMTMAKKGLANMAITACFAGPVFNILIGLGGGFTKLNTSTGVDAEVDLLPPISVGFIFLLCNCILVLFSGLVWNRGRIPGGYGYIALALYVFYVVISVW